MAIAAGQDLGLRQTDAVNDFVNWLLGELSFMRLLQLLSDTDER